MTNPDLQETIEALETEISGFAGYSITHHRVGEGLIDAAQAALTLLKAQEETIETMEKIDEG